MQSAIDVGNKVQYPASQKQKMRGTELTSLDELFSRKEAAAAIGVSEVTLKRWQQDEKVIGIGIGSRVNEQHGEYYHTVAYTQRMIDEMKAEAFPVEPSQEEIDCVLGGDEVAVMLNKPRYYVSQHSSKEPIIPHKKVGNISVYIRKDVEEFKKKYIDLMVVVKNGRVGDYDLARAITQYMERNELSQNKASQELNFPRQYIGKILNGQEQRIKESELARLKEVFGG